MSNENKTWYGLGEKNAQGQVEISIYDEIGFWGVSASDFIADVKGATESASEIVLRVNSPGGEVFDGLAIYNYLKGIKTPVTGIVDGLAASMASVVLMAADNIIVPENAFVMIHNPWGGRMGDAEEMRKTADLLDKLGDSIAVAYSARTGKDKADVLALMDDETWMNGTEAVEMGFADFTSEAVQVAASLNLGSLRDIPAGLSQQIMEAKEMSEIADLKEQLSAIETERDEFSAKVEEAEALKAGHTEAVEQANTEGIEHGTAVAAARIADVSDRYDAEFAVAHGLKTDDELATLWAELKPEGDDGVVSQASNPIPTAFDYDGRVKELKAEGLSAKAAHREAKIEQAAIKPADNKE